MGSETTRRMVITAVCSGMSQTEAARTYGVSQSWVSRLMARYRIEGQAAYTPRSTRPHTSPNQTSARIVDRVVQLREELTGQGLDAGAETICWYLEQERLSCSRATVHRILVRSGQVKPEPTKRPKASYRRFQAEWANECWQSDFTHYRLTNGAAAEIITWLDDHSRYCLHLSAHTRISAAIAAQTFTSTAKQYGWPASTLTDNGMVYTARLAGQGRRGGRTQLENLLQHHHIRQKNGSPSHPQTQGKVERFQQTLKKWLRAQPHQPATLTQLNKLLATFAAHYNHQRPHRALPHRATPAAVYALSPKATPNTTPQPHQRIRTDRVDKTGNITLRLNGRLHHIGIGRPSKGTCITMLVQDHDVTIINTQTGQIIRELTIDPTRDYQPIGPKKKPEPPKRRFRPCQCPETSQ